MAGTSDSTTVTVRQGVTFIIDGEDFYIEEAGNGIVEYSCTNHEGTFTEPVSYFKERLLEADFWHVKEGKDPRRTRWQNSYSGGRA